MGERAGLTVAEFAESYPEAHARWASGHITGGVPGSETIADVTARMVPALHECSPRWRPADRRRRDPRRLPEGVAWSRCSGCPSRPTRRSSYGQLRVGQRSREHRSGRLRLSSYNETAHPGVLPPRGPPISQPTPLG